MSNSFSNRLGHGLVDCLYTNSSSGRQVVRLSNSSVGLERIVEPGQQLAFQSEYDGVLEISDFGTVTSVAEDRIKCTRLTGNTDEDSNEIHRLRWTVLRRLIPYALALAALGGIAIAQTGPLPEFSPPKQESAADITAGPRRLTITVAVADPEDLKVAEGDRVSSGQLIADRTRDRNRLEAQARQLDLTLQRLEHSTITPPLPPATPPPIATPTYLEEIAAIARAKADVDQAEALIAAKHQELDYLAQLPNLDPLVMEPEQAKLAVLQRSPIL